MTYLLDVNVLIALIDPHHVHHDIAHNWFTAKANKSWATCAITENGVIRILANPRYPNWPGSPVVVVDHLKDLQKAPGHRFWSESVSLLDDNVVRIDQIRSSHQVTDCYLLSLAVHNHGLLATFDRRISADAVIGGDEALHVIET
ncbi:VapC toxin family PIN domain ribonuclease [Metarhizobium album]|uniref:Ribonuclease VapC n=1 Tax=Metarhizobium album TaxID=2182425 RepID=A0A2U2DTD6_9HYPH|nr:TA system VapC family ribonuclease toxin [Rhizobium album]PWE56562.1 VapC toxin family PIN domain ribonuclease [Rhizobium album]